MIDIFQDTDEHPQWRVVLLAVTVAPGTGSAPHNHGTLGPQSQQSEQEHEGPTPERFTKQSLGTIKS